jgi:hypothetical protein
MANKSICPHCSRVAGRRGSRIDEAHICCLCSKDYARVVAIARLAFRVRAVPGTPPQVMSKLFLRWAEQNDEGLAVEAMKTLMRRWEVEDADDAAEAEARR